MRRYSLACKSAVPDKLLPPPNLSGFLCREAANVKVCRKQARDAIEYIQKALTCITRCKR